MGTWYVVLGTWRRRRDGPRPIARCKQISLPNGEGWGRGLGSGQWPVARGMWKPLHYVVKRALECSLPTSDIPPPTSRQTTPLRPAATSPAGGGKRRGPWPASCSPWSVLSVVGADQRVRPKGSWCVVTATRRPVAHDSQRTGIRFVACIGQSPSLGRGLGWGFKSGK